MNRHALQNLADRCSEWDGDNETFSALIRDYLKITGKPPRVLAKEFEYSLSEISRWASGESTPRPHFQAYVVRQLEEFLTSLLGTSKQTC